VFYTKNLLILLFDSVLCIYFLIHCILTVCICLLLSHSWNLKSIFWQEQIEVFTLTVAFTNENNGSPFLFYFLVYLQWNLYFTDFVAFPFGHALENNYPKLKILFAHDVQNIKIALVFQPYKSFWMFLWSNRRTIP